MSWFPDLGLDQTLFDCSPHPENATRATDEASSEQISLSTIAPADMSLHPIESFHSIEPQTEVGNWLSEDTGIGIDGWSSTRAVDFGLPGNPSNLYPVSNNTHVPWPTTNYDAYPIQQAGMCVPQPIVPIYTDYGLPSQPVGPAWARPMMTAPLPDNLDMLTYISRMLEYWTALEQEKKFRSACG